MTGNRSGNTLTLAGTTGELHVGHTAKLGTGGLLWVRGIEGGTAATITADVNGTTLTGSGAQALEVVQYPRPVMEATLIEAAKLWKRKDSSFSSIIGMSDVGSIEIIRGFDAQTKMMLSPFVKRVV